MHLRSVYSQSSMMAEAGATRVYHVSLAWPRRSGASLGQMLEVSYMKKTRIAARHSLTVASSYVGRAERCIPATASSHDVGDSPERSPRYHNAYQLLVCGDSS